MPAAVRGCVGKGEGTLGREARNRACRDQQSRRAHQAIEEKRTFIGRHTPRKPFAFQPENGSCIWPESPPFPAVRGGAWPSVLRKKINLRAIRISAGDAGELASNPLGLCRD